MTFLGAMLALLLPTSAWRVIHRRQREHIPEWGRASPLLLQSQEEKSATTPPPTEDPPPPDPATSVAAEHEEEQKGGETDQIPFSKNKDELSGPNNVPALSLPSSGRGDGGGGDDCSFGADTPGVSAAGSHGSNSLPAANVHKAGDQTSSLPPIAGHGGGGEERHGDGTSDQGGRGASGDPGGIDTSLNLSLGWEGFVLEDVELRRDFLAELLGLPIDVPHAFVRKAVVHVPWYTLMLGSFVAKLEGVTIVMRGDVGAMTASSTNPRSQEQDSAGNDHRVYSADSVAQFVDGMSGGLDSGARMGATHSKSETSRQHPLPRWLKWLLRRLKVQLMDVTIRYESVGMCPLQGAPPSAVEVTLGSLEVRPVSLQGASAWFKGQIKAQRRGHQYREELMLQGLAVRIEPLDDPAASSGTINSNQKVFLLEPTSVSAQAFVVSRLPPRSTPLRPGMRSGRVGTAHATIRAISLSGEAWRTIRPSFLEDLPNLMRTWTQGDRTSLTNEPVTVNATEDSMTLAWGVVEELMRLADMHSGAGVGFGDMGVGNDYSDEEEGDSEQWYDAFGSQEESNEDDRRRNSSDANPSPSSLPPSAATITSTVGNPSAETASSATAAGADATAADASTTTATVNRSALDRFTLGPRAKPGLEVSMSLAGLKINLVRRPAPGEKAVIGAYFPGKTTAREGMHVGGQQPWLERCRIMAMDLRAGGVREPSDGWGSPPPEHRAWASILSLTAGAPPVSVSRPGSYRDRGGGSNSSTASTKTGGAASGRNSSAERASAKLTFREVDGSKIDDAGARQPPPYLICRPPPDGRAVPTTGAGSVPPTATSARGSAGSTIGGVCGRKASSDRDRNPKSSDQPIAAKFLELKAGGRAGGAAGTGKSASLVVSMGQVETWALGGAATRWWARLGPKPGVLPESTSSSTRTGNMNDTGGVHREQAAAAREKEPSLLQALFSGGHEWYDNVGTNPGLDVGRDREVTTGTVSRFFLQLSFDLHTVVVYLPVDRGDPFGRSLRLSLGGVSARNLSSATSPSTSVAVSTAHYNNSSPTTSNRHVSPTPTGGAEHSTPVASGLRPARSPGRVGFEASVFAIGASWTCLAGAGGDGRGRRSDQVPSSTRNTTRQSERPASMRRGRRNLNGRQASTDSIGSCDSGRRTRAGLNVDRRLFPPFSTVDSGNDPTSAFAASESLVVLDVRDAITMKLRWFNSRLAGASGGVRCTGNDGREDKCEGIEEGHGVQERVDEPGAAGSEEEAAGVESTIGGGDDLEESVAPSFPPPMATRQESVSVDVKVADIPITISACALTELAWIVGGFSVGQGSDNDGKPGVADMSEGRQVGGGQGSAGEDAPRRKRRGSSGTRTGSSGSSKNAMSRSTSSPLMPVKVIYRRPSKVRRLLLRVRIASLRLHLMDAARLPKVGTGPEVLSSTMPWGINPPRGHPILAARLDEVALAMVVREASGRRRDIASTTGSSQGSAEVDKTEKQWRRSRRREYRSTSSTGWVSGAGGQGMTEGAITLAVALIHLEGCDTGCEKPRGVMLPILVASPLRGITATTSTVNTAPHPVPSASSASAMPPPPLPRRASASSPHLQRSRRPAQPCSPRRISDEVPRGTATEIIGDTANRSGRSEPPPAEGVGGGGADMRDESRGGGGSARRGEVSGNAGGRRKRGHGRARRSGSIGEDGSRSTPPQALVVSGKWTLEPLHGCHQEGRRRRRRRRRNSVSPGGAGHGAGDVGAGVEGGASGVLPSVGEVGVGLVKRSLEIRVGRLELWPDPPILGRISHLVRATMGAKDLSTGLVRRELVRKSRRERGLGERPPGGDGDVWPAVDDPLEELTELVWPSSELPAFEVHFCVGEAAMVISFHGRPLSEVQLKRGLTIGVKTYRPGLGRRAMECRGSADGLLLWDRTGSASGELACVISGLDGPHPSASDNPVRLMPQSFSTGMPRADVISTTAERATGLREAAREVDGGLPVGPANNDGVTLEWSFTGRISEAEAKADSEANVTSSGLNGKNSVEETSTEKCPLMGTTAREPRPPILQARFAGARVIYMQRCTMELYCNISQRLIPSLKSASRRPEDSLCGSPVALLAKKAGLCWVQGCTPKLPERRRTEKACARRPIVMEIVCRDSEFHLPECSDPREGRTDALVLEIPRLCMFRPPVRRCLPSLTHPSGVGENAEVSSSSKTNKEEQSEVSGETQGTGAGEQRQNEDKGKGRGRSLGVGLGQAGRTESGWEEGEPTDFVYTGLFPHEVKGASSEQPELFLFEDEGTDNGQALELLAARENELLSQEDKERRDEEETGGDVTKAEEALLIAENLHHTLSTVGNKAEPIGVVRGGGVGVSTASGGEDGAGESGHDRQLMEAAMEVVKQVNRVGDLKLSLEERQRALSITRSHLAAVRREAAVEKTAQEEKRRFEAHRPKRIPPAPWRFDMVASGVNIRTYRSANMMAKDVSLRAWIVIPSTLRPWCGGGDPEDSGMYSEVWESLGFLPSRDPMFVRETLDVTVLIDHLDATLTRAQYATILAIIMDNFPEPWSVCPPVIEWPIPDPDVTQGVCRDPLKGRHTAQSIPVYARRVTLKICEDEDAFFFIPHEEGGVLDHRRRDWTQKHRGIRPPQRGAPEAEGAALGIGSAAAAAAARSRRVSMVVSSDHGDREVGEQKSRERGLSQASDTSASSRLSDLEREIQAMASNLDGFSDDGDTEPDESDDEANESAAKVEVKVKNQSVAHIGSNSQGLNPSDSTAVDPRDQVITDNLRKSDARGSAEGGVSDGVKAASPLREEDGVPELRSHRVDISGSSFTGSDFVDTSSFYSGGPDVDSPPTRPIALIDTNEFFLVIDKKFMNGGMAIACGAGTITITDLSDDGRSMDQNGIGDSTLYGPDGPAQGGGAATGAEIVSPLVSTGNVHVHGTGRGPKHPGWGFGYNGSDPRVRFEPQIWYDMQMATDYKRCSIFVSDTRVVALAEGLLGVKAYFVEPVTDFRTRDRMLRPYRYAEVRPNNLDVELVLANAYICHPESQNDCATHYGSSSSSNSGIGTKGKQGSTFKASAGRAAVVHADLTLTQIWRGMPETGPGSSLLSVTALATSVFLAPLSEPCPPQPGEALSLVTPLLVSVHLETVTAAPSWRRSGPAERWAGMQGGERTRAGRKLAAAAAAAAALAGDSPIPPRDPSPEPPDAVDKADVAAAEVEEAERQERAAEADPATVSRSMSAVFTEATEARLRRWKRNGVADLHGGSWTGGGGADDGGESGHRGGLGGLEARLSLSDVKFFTGTIRSLNAAVNLAKAATPARALRLMFRQEMVAFARNRGSTGPLTMEGRAFVTPRKPMPNVDVPAPVVRAASVKSSGGSTAKVSTIQAGFGLPDLRLTLVSNALSLPLFHFDVLQLQAALRHEAGKYLDATASASVSAGYFNQALYRWEPVVEEAPLIGALHRDESNSSSAGAGGGNDDKEARSSKVGVMEAQLSLPEVVNLNVTHAMVSAARIKAMALSEDRVTTGSRSLQPLRLRNRCGEALAITICNRRGGAEAVRLTLGNEKDDMVDIGALSRGGGETSRGLRSSTSGTRNAPSVDGDDRDQSSTVSAGDASRWDSAVLSSAAADQRYSLRLAMRYSGRLFVSSQACPIDVAGVHIMRMQRVDGSSPKPRTSFELGVAPSDKSAPEPVFLIAEVSVHDDGSRLLTVRTRVSIENTCGVPVRLSLGLPGGKRMERELGSGMTAHVPLSFLKSNLQIYSRPVSASYTNEWAPLVSSLAVTERKAEMATRDRGQEHSSGVGVSKVFAMSSAPAAGTARGVRGFATGAGVTKMTSMVAPAGWWVLSEVSYKHEPTPTASSSTANANLKMSNLDVSRHDLTRRSELNLGLHGSGFDSSDSLTAAFTSGECLRRMSSASALHKAGFQEDKDGDEGEFDPEVGDTGMQDGWVISPVLDAGTADIAGSAVKQQPWFPLGPSSSTSDTGRGWWKGGGGDDKGKAASRLAVSETDDSGVSEDYDDGDEDGNKSSSSHGTGSDTGLDVDTLNEELLPVETDTRQNGDEKLTLERVKKKFHRSATAVLSATRLKKPSSGNLRGKSALAVSGGWSEADIWGGDFGNVSAVRNGAKRFFLKREIRSTKAGAIENVLREVAEESPLTPPRKLVSGMVASPPPTVSFCLRAPLVIHNLLCVPLLYRVMTRQGLMSAEGVLPVGASLPLQRVDLCQKQYASFLVVNYPWSPFLKVHSPTSAHPARERVRALELRGQKISVTGEDGKKGRELPSLHLHCAMQGRDVSIFSRLWLINRTEMVLQHRDASLGMGVDATFMGDRMPQITQPGLQEAPMEGGDVEDGAKGSSGIFSEYPRSGDSMSRGNIPSPTLSGNRPWDAATAGRDGAKRVSSSLGTSNAGVSRLIFSPGGGRRGQSVSSGTVGLTMAGGSLTGEDGVGSAPKISFNVALPFCHLEEVDVEIGGSEAIESLLAVVSAAAGLGPIDPADYFLCPLQPPSEDDTLAFTEIATSEMDKLSLVDGQLRALRQQFGVSSGGAKASPSYSRWDRLGFVFDEYRPLHPSTLVSNLGTPWLRMCHRAELVAASQTSQWLGAELLPGTGLSALAGAHPAFVGARRKTVQAPVTTSPTPSAGFFSAIQSVGASAIVRATGTTDGRAPVTGSKGCSARLSETVKGVATAADWGRAVMFSPSASLGSFQLCSRVPDSEWCSPVDVASLKAAAGGTTCISLVQEKASSRDAAPRTLYDVGIQVGPGEGDFRRTMVLTLVPRYILVNTLPRALEYTQAACGGRWRGILPPGGRQAFHWPFAGSRHALSVRFLSKREENEPEDAWMWSGDLTLDTLGEVAVKLRTAAGVRGMSVGWSRGSHSEYIARVKLALVGASVTAVFERQDLRWPPYRIDNLTSLGIRYRQALSSSDASRVPAASGLWGSGGKAGRPGELPWDSLGPQAAAPFSWDQPAGESRVLIVGFEQAGKWEEREYRLDELMKHRRVALTRTLPSMDHPRLKGDILQRKSGTLGTVWKRRWGVLKGPVLYLFHDRTYVTLKGVIYLGATRSRGRQGTRADGVGAVGPQRAKIRQKTSGRANGDILDKMGTIMDDAVGFLVGPELVRPEASSATAVASAVAKNAAAAPAARATPAAGGDGTGGGAGLEGRAKDVEAGALRAEEALALAGMIWNYMSSKTDTHFSSWGMDGVSRRMLSQSSAHSVQVMEDGGGVARVETPGLLAHLRPTASASGRRLSADVLTGDTSSTPGDGMSGMDPTRRFSSSQPLTGLTLAEWSRTLEGMDLFRRHEPPVPRAVEAAAGSIPSEAERMCRHLVDLALLVPIPTQRRHHAHSSNAAGGTLMPFPPAAEQSSPPPAGQGVSRGRGVSERSGAGREESKGERRRPAGASTEPSSKRYLLRNPDRDVDLDSHGEAELTVVATSGAAHDLRCDNTADALRWIEAMRDAVDTDCVSSLQDSRLEKEGLDGGDKRKSTTDSIPEDARYSGSRLEGGEAIMSRMRAKVYVKVRVRADGPTKVLELEEEAGEDVEDDDGAVAAAWGRGKEGLPSTAAADAEAGAEVAAATANVNSVYMLQIAGVGVSLVDDRPLELLYFLACGIQTDVTATETHRMLSFTVDSLQVDNQLSSALFPALLRPRPLPPPKRLSDGTKAPVGIIQLDGLAPRPADRLPALHFYAKRRAADPITPSVAEQRPSIIAASDSAGRYSVVNPAGDAGGKIEVGDRRVGMPRVGWEDEEERQREDLDQVVYYYDVATAWIRPVDIKVEEAIFLALMRLREKMGFKAARHSPRNKTGDDYGNPIAPARTSQYNKGGAGGPNIGKYTQQLWKSLGEPSPHSSSPRANPRRGEAAGAGDEHAAISQAGWETRGGNQFWGAGTRLGAFSDTLSAGESALSPAVFDLEGGRRAEVKIYFALMHLHPLDMRITYRSTPGQEVQDADELTLSTIAQLNDARLCLNALQLEHAFGGRAVFVGVMLKHYKLAFLTQVHNVVGSFDFLGDPVGLLSNLSTGVKDFFYEPIEGLKPDGKGFLYGLGKGGTSLVSNTVQGTFNTFNKVTGSLGDTISHLSLDTDYRKRRVRQRLVQGETMADSMAHGAKEFGRGIFQGVTGVVMEPYLGAEKEGVLGFGKGMVKGVMGVAVKPVVGVFDLGARAFEGIRNASRMDDDSMPEEQHPHQQGREEEHDNFDSSHGSTPTATTADARKSPIHSHPRTSALSPTRNTANRRIGGGAGIDFGGGVGGGGVALLAQRARPPRRFGPLGEMDPFTWDDAVAQAILRAVKRDDGDVSSERIYFFRRIELRTRHTRGLMVKATPASARRGTSRAMTGAGYMAPGTPGRGGKTPLRGGRQGGRRGSFPPGGEARLGGRGWSSATAREVDSSSSPDEEFVCRWVIVTDKRMLHAQEEPGWGLDKEKISALDLTRFGVQFSPWSGVLGGVRVLWGAPLSCVRNLKMEPEGIKVALSSPVQFSTDHQELSLFSYTQQGGGVSANQAVVCDPDTMSELAVLACLQGTLGPQFAQLHLVRPHKYSICIQGFLTRIEEIGLLTKMSRHWYAVANGILYEYSARKDASEGSSNSSAYSGGGGPGAGGSATAGQPFSLTTVLPLSRVQIRTGKVEGNENCLKMNRALADPKHRDPGNLPVVTASARLGSVLKEAALDEMILQADNRNSLQSWAHWLSSQRSSPSSASRVPSRRERGTVDSDAASDAGFQQNPYTDVFITCESMEVDEALKLYDDLSTAVSTAKVE